MLCISLVTCLLIFVAEEFPLPSGWADYLPDADKKWVSKALKCKRVAKTQVKVDPDRMWFDPPPPQLIPSLRPSVHRYFARRLFVWMPKLLWHAVIGCVRPECQLTFPNDLVRAGNYPVVRRVVTLDGYYHMVTERYECSKCKAKYVGWSGAMVGQLDVSRRVQFPVLLTYR